MRFLQSKQTPKWRNWRKRKNAQILLGAWLPHRDRSKRQGVTPPARYIINPQVRHNYITGEEWGQIWEDSIPFEDLFLPWYCHCSCVWSCSLSELTFFLLISPFLITFSPIHWLQSCFFCVLLVTERLPLPFCMIWILWSFRKLHLWELAESKTDSLVIIRRHLFDYFCKFCHDSLGGKARGLRVLLILTKFFGSNFLHGHSSRAGLQNWLIPFSKSCFQKHCNGTELLWSNVIHL